MLSGEPVERETTGGLRKVLTWADLDPDAAPLLEIGLTLPADLYGAMRPASAGNALARRNALKAGVEFEAEQLAQLGLAKNTGVWRPTVEQAQSAGFKIIVGEAKYTREGLLRGTILDATEGGFLEIKGGISILDSSYQLRLQTYRSLVEDVPFTIRTLRPVNPTFKGYLDRWGVIVEPTK